MSGRPRTGVSRRVLLEKGHKNIIVGELILEYLFANRLQCRVPADLLFYPLLLSFQLITREHFEDALKELQDEGIIVVMGKNTIRIC